MHHVTTVLPTEAGRWGRSEQLQLRRTFSTPRHAENEMLLIRKKGASTPKELGLFWPMQTIEGATVDVFVYASALQAFDADAVGPVGLLKRHRTLLQSLASEKYDRAGVTGANFLHITATDLCAGRAGDGIADDV